MTESINKFFARQKAARTLQENSTSVSSTKGIFTESDKDGLTSKGNSTITKNSSSTNNAWTSQENSRTVSPAKGICTLKESDKVGLTSKGNSTITENSPSTISSATSFNSVSSKDVCLGKEHYSLSEKFERLYQSKRFADVTIKVKGKEFLAHKLILSTSSEVFASMFEHDTSEKRSQVIDITDCDPHSFENFLLYLYTGKLISVPSSKATSLFKTADKYGVGELRDECIRCMSRDMTVDSFCDVFHLALLHDESDLLATATNFFIRNASAILITKEWLTLLEEHTSLCNELLVKFAKSNSELSSKCNRLDKSRGLRSRLSVNEFILLN